jgi:hypothetical protein
MDLDAVVAEGLVGPRFGPAIIPSRDIPMLTKTLPIVLLTWDNSLRPQS